MIMFGTPGAHANDLCSLRTSLRSTRRSNRSQPALSVTLIAPSATYKPRSNDEIKSTSSSKMRS